MEGDTKDGVSASAGLVGTLQSDCHFRSHPTLRGGGAGLKVEFCPKNHFYSTEERASLWGTSGRDQTPGQHSLRMGRNS